MSPVRPLQHVMPVQTVQPPPRGRSQRSGRQLTGALAVRPATPSVADDSAPRRPPRPAQQAEQANGATSAMPSAAAAATTEGRREARASCGPAGRAGAKGAAEAASAPRGPACSAGTLNAGAAVTFGPTTTGAAASAGARPTSAYLDTSQSGSMMQWAPSRSHFPTVCLINSSPTASHPCCALLTGGDQGGPARSAKNGP